MRPRFPKYCLLYYKNVVDRCFRRFFEDFNRRFEKRDDGKFAFTGHLSDRDVSLAFDAYLEDEISSQTRAWKESEPEFFFIIGSCVPCENAVLSDFDESQASRAKRAMGDYPDLRYFLKEDDIVMDMRSFNSEIERMFLSNFGIAGRRRKNVFFVRHRALDCYFLYKMMKRRYGSMCVNLHKENRLGDDRCIYSVNERLDDICGRKLEFLRGELMTGISEELYRYIDLCLESV